MTYIDVKLLKEYNGDYKKLLKEELIRNYGVFFFLREDSKHYSEDKLKELVKENNNSRIKYLKGLLEEYEDRIEKPELKEDKIREEYDDLIKDYRDMIDKYNKELKELLEYKSKLENVCSLNITVTEILDKLKKHIDERIEDCNTSIKHYTEGLNRSYNEYKNNVIEGYKRDKKFYKERKAEILKQIKDVEDDADFYDKFVEAVDSL